MSVTFCLMGYAIADAAAPTPARFVDGDLSLQKLIEFPDVDHDVLTVMYCFVYVMRSGELRRNHCFLSESVDRPFRIAVDTAVELARASPATVDGKSHFIALYYRVIFLQKDGVAEVGVYPNWGNHVDKYGLSYEAPQRYTQSIYPEKCNALNFLLATMLIGEDGTLTGDVAFSGGEGMHMEWCKESVKAIHLNAKYIPGHKDGQPVEATFVEAWGLMEFLPGHN